MLIFFFKHHPCREGGQKEANVEKYGKLIENAFISHSMIHTLCVSQSMHLHLSILRYPLDHIPRICHHLP